MSLRQKRKKYRTSRQVLIMIVELLMVVILGALVFGWYQWAKIRHDKLDLNKLEAYQDTGAYTNIALFGVDSRGQDLDAGVNSDTIMVASISNKTKEVKLVSVYRDCIMRQKDGKYRKANYAYSRGGGEEAIAELNRNLDLDIKNYISVNFTAMVKVIDAVGGIEIDVQQEEIEHLNRFTKEVVKASGVSTSPVTKAGKQTLDGVQATSYARIRYTAGGDFKRAERQRLVLQKILEKAKKLKMRQLKKIADEVMPLISTSFSAKDVLSMAVNASKYELKGTKGFPFEVTTMSNPRGLSGSYVVPADMVTNVKELHKYLFKNDSYSPSETVQGISDDIIYMTGIEAGVANAYDQSENDSEKDSE